MSEITGLSKLTGSLSAPDSLKGSLSGNDILVGTVSSDLSRVSYDGDYVIIPKPYEEQELATKDKFMDEDLIVKEIPLFQTTNLAGGFTVCIGGQ